MKFILPALLILSFSAHALLGGTAAEIEKDLPQLGHRQVAVQAASTSCYSVKQIEGDGVSLKEYVNTSTDSVFMIRMNSRAPLSFKPLMRSADFEEYRQASTARSVQKFSRNHRNLTTETARLKVHLDDRQVFHRSLMILKPSVPSCVANPESLQ